MGSVVSRLVDTAGLLASRGLKRTLEELEDDDEDRCGGADFDRLMNTPKKRKLVSTMTYIYETMFKEGQGSDVTLYALGRQWKLHKLYLSQSPYFKSMFSNNWRESREDEITIEIIDPNITMKGLETALGSLYHDEVQLQPADIVSVVAAAALFQLDGLLTQCAEVMRSCINVQTAIAFLEAAAAYSLKPVQDCCQQWLENNLMTHVNDHPAVLRQLSPAVLASLVSSPSLLVHQTEFSLYVVLKAWLFLRLSPEWQGSGQQAVVAAHKFFEQRADEEPLLSSEEAAPLAAPFRALRHHHLVMHPLDLKVLRADNVVPAAWLAGLYEHHWLTLLRLDQGLVETGWARDVTEAQFDACALRCGRTLEDRRKCTWRWTGFNFGLDLVMVHCRRQIALRRNARQDLSMLISQANTRDVLYRVRAISLDEQRMPRHVQDTGLQHVQLARGQETHVLTVDEAATFPLLISVGLMTAPDPWRPAEDT